MVTSHSQGENVLLERIAPYGTARFRFRYSKDSASADTLCPVQIGLLEPAALCAGWLSFILASLALFETCPMTIAGLAVSP